MSSFANMFDFFFISFRNLLIIKKISLVSNPFIKPHTPLQKMGQSQSLRSQHHWGRLQPRLERRRPRFGSWLHQDSLMDSINTSVVIGLFQSKEFASYYHVFFSTPCAMRITAFKSGRIRNFNPKRLCSKTPEEAYPVSMRPRGARDIESVKYFRKQIQQYKQIPRIWVLKDIRSQQYFLLDGAHRVVACHLEGMKEIDCFLIFK